MLGRTFRGECVLSIHTSIFALALAAAPLACSDSQPGTNNPGNSSTAGSSNPGAGGSSNPATGGSSNPATGGSSNPATGGSSNPATGGSNANTGGSTGGTAPNPIPDPSLGDITPLFNEATTLEPAVVVETPEALKTYWSDRARDRHAREARFNSYEHYLHIYWERRTAEVEIVDTVGKDPNGGSVTFNVKTLWKLDDKQAELRFFFRGIGTVAEYSDNRPMTPTGAVGDFTYTRTVTQNATTGGALKVGDKMEFELSQFLDKNYNAAQFSGRDNYYGTTMLYVVGRGLVPWAQTGKQCQNGDEMVCRDSEPVPDTAWLGGHTTGHELSSGEPENVFMQMAGNLAPINGQRFVQGRRVIHTDFTTGKHDESAENPMWNEQAGKLGPLSINFSCNQCHFQNSRAVPGATGTPLNKYVFKVGDKDGNPTAQWGGVLQPTGGEPSASIASWTEENGLRKPVFAFSGGTPENYSPRVSPQLVGMGLLEAIPEVEILKLADPEDKITPDGISGRVHKVKDPVDPSITRLGRFGWKAGQASVKYQVAGALRTDMGVLTSVFPTPDCGSGQQNCGASMPELSDTDLDNATAYISLLGIKPQRDWTKPEVVQGQQVFMSTGCASCHTPEFKTSKFAMHAELRDQTIRPYTDLLLHDMGDGLADTLPEGEATYLEWRTPPLWGIGYTASTAGAESYLHDGRARTLTEAILWHGGEGKASKEKFEALPEGEKNALLAFLKSL
jgi:CxxC motif-containing protein (DUF1111 family)